MSIEDLYQSSPVFLIDALEPYQQNLINDLLSVTDNDFAKAAELWLSATPSQTAWFGGSKSHSGVYLEKVVEEIEKFVCGTDDSYQNYRDKLSETTDASQKYIVGVLSTAIGANLGVAGAFIAPIIVLVIMSFGRISINAWCALRKEKRET